MTTEFLERADRSLVGWLRAGKYRCIQHRHNGCWRAEDGDPEFCVNADTAEELAAKLSRVPIIDHVTLAAHAIKTVAVVWGLDIGLLMSRRRSALVSEARFAAYALLVDRGMRSVTIGTLLGRDPSSIDHGAGRCQDLAESDPAYRALLERARTEFNQSCPA